MATHSSILLWEIPWTEEPGGLQSMGLQKVGRDLVTKQQQQRHYIFSLTAQVYEPKPNKSTQTFLEIIDSEGDSDH